MKHLTPYRKNERSLSPMKGRGMVYGGEVMLRNPINPRSPFFSKNILLFNFREKREYESQ